MISMGGHLIRVQNVDATGMTVDDPRGTLEGTGDLVEGNTKSSNVYNLGDRGNTTTNPNRGEDDLWKWEDVEKITIKAAILKKLILM